MPWRILKILQHYSGMGNVYLEKTIEVKSIIKNNRSFVSFVKKTNFKKILKLMHFCGKYPVKECEKFTQLVLDYFQEDTQKIYELFVSQADGYSREASIFLEALSKKNTKASKELIRQYWVKKNWNKRDIAFLITKTHVNDFEYLFRKTNEADKKEIALLALTFSSKNPLFIKNLKRIGSVFEKSNFQEKIILLPALLTYTRKKQIFRLLKKEIGKNKFYDIALENELYAVDDLKIKSELIKELISKKTDEPSGQIYYYVTEILEKNYELAFELLLKIIEKHALILYSHEKLLEPFSKGINSKRIDRVIRALKKNKNIKKKGMFNYFLSELLSKLCFKNEKVLFLYLKKWLYGTEKELAIKLIKNCSEPHYQLKEERSSKKFKEIEIINEFIELTENYLILVKKKFRKKTKFSCIREYYDYLYYLCYKITQPRLKQNIISKNIEQYPTLKKILFKNLQKKIAEGYADNLLLILLSREKNGFRTETLDLLESCLNCLIEGKDRIKMVRDNLLNDVQTEDTISELVILKQFRTFPKINYEIYPKLDKLVPDGSLMVERRIFLDIIHPKLDSDLSFSGKAICMDPFNGFGKIVEKINPAEIKNPFIVLVDASGSEKREHSILNAVHGVFGVMLEKDKKEPMLKEVGCFRDSKKKYDKKDFSTISAVIIYHLIRTKYGFRFQSKIIPIPIAKTPLTQKELEKLKEIFDRELIID